VHFGVSAPPFEDFFQPRTLAQLAHDAEQAGWDGVAPLKASAEFGESLTPDDTHAIAAFCAEHRTATTPFDVLSGPHTADSTDTALPHAHADAGATWWIEDVSPWPFGWKWEGAWPVEAMRNRIRAGPPAF